MENTIATTRANYIGVGIALTILLVVALLYIQNSTGIIRGGDDEGSGIGGTGLAPSESGFGGTGLKPFLGMNENESIKEVLVVTGGQQSSIAAISSQVDFSKLQATEVGMASESAPQVTAAQFKTHNSSPIHITEAIQASLDERAGYSATSTAAEVENSADLPIEATVTDYAFNTIGNVDPNRSAEVPSTADPLPEAELELSTSAAAVSLDNDRVASTNWSALTDYLVNESIRAEIDSAYNSDNTANLQRPITEPRSAPTRKIQRPELPPIQRVRPIERLSVLPPRIQPLGR